MKVGGIYDTISKKEKGREQVSQFEKLRAKFYKKPIPNDIRTDEAITLAKAYGCEIRTGGNHQVKVVYRPTGTIIPLPQHGDTIKEAYVKELKQLFDKIESEVVE